MELYERLEELDADKAEMRASRILHGLGFTAAMQQKKLKDFSGGWRMRVALARWVFRISFWNSKLLGDDVIKGRMIAQLLCANCAMTKTVRSEFSDPFSSFNECICISFNNLRSLGSCFFIILSSGHCSSSLSCCCWMSQQTTWTWMHVCGWRKNSASKSLFLKQRLWENMKSNGFHLDFLLWVVSDDMM